MGKSKDRTFNQVFESIYNNFVNQENSVPEKPVPVVPVPDTRTDVQKAIDSLKFVDDMIDEIQSAYDNFNEALRQAKERMLKNMEENK